MTPRLSVIVPAHDAGAFLIETLICLERQTLDGLEVIVVDDGSADGSVDAARRWAASRREARADMHFLTQPKAGVSAARNRGIAAARAGLIGFLDADDLWLPEKAQHHVTLMETSPQVVFSFSSYINVDENGIRIGEPFKVRPGLRAMREFLTRNIIHTSTVVARKDAIEQVGSFDTGLRTYEDLDLWLRLADLDGVEVHAFEDVDTHYRRHSGQTSRDWVAMRQGWEKMAEHAAQRYPEAWKTASATASAYQHEYGAWLAHASGDFRAMRRMILAAWLSSPSAMLRSRFAFMGTAIAAASLLPRSAQKVLGKSYVVTADLARRVRERKLREPRTPAHDALPTREAQD